jgi:hypothetical protein
MGTSGTSTGTTGATTGAPGGGSGASTDSGTSGSNASGEGGSGSSGSEAGASPAPGFVGDAGPIGCDRAGLQTAVNYYLAAVEAGDPTRMPVASSATYTEVSQTGTVTGLGMGLWQSALAVSFNRSLLDVTTCETFTEVFITTASHPYVLGTRLTVSGTAITAVYTLVTQNGDWNFDATAYETCDESEDWSVLPASAQSTRDDLIADAQAYYDDFQNNNVTVPWGMPCYRLEGGKGCTPQIDMASMSCDVGVPSGITFTTPHWVVDLDLATVEGISLFGGTGGLPDSHLFRTPNGKFRYVHTLTVCTVANCGM